MNNKYVRFIQFVYSNNCVVMESDFEKKIVRLDVYSTIKDTTINQFKQIAYEDFGFIVKIRKNHVCRKSFNNETVDSRSAESYKHLRQWSVDKRHNQV